MYKKTSSDWRYKLAHFPDEVYKIFASIQKIVLKLCNDSIRWWQSIFSIEKGNLGFKRARFLAYPWSRIIWVWIYKKSKQNNVERILTDMDGFHVIGGNTGAGKSSLAFELAERDRILLGKPWYFNTEIEKARFNEDLKAYIRYHKFIPFHKVWSGFKMHLQLNKKYYSAYLIDELHRIFDYRQNQTIEYLASFEPFRDYAVVSRKHIGRIIGITQMDRLDIQLMYLVKYWHKPRIDVGFDVPDWMHKTGLFRFKPIGWHITSYTVDTSDPYNMLKEHSKWYLPNEFADFDYFDTYAFSDAYNYLPMDQPKLLKGN